MIVLFDLFCIRIITRRYHEAYKVLRFQNLFCPLAIALAFFFGREDITEMSYIRNMYAIFLQALIFLCGFSLITVAIFLRGNRAAMKRLQKIKSEILYAKKTHDYLPSNSGRMDVPYIVEYNRHDMYFCTIRLPIRKRINKHIPIYHYMLHNRICLTSLNSFLRSCANFILHSNR